MLKIKHIENNESFAANEFANTINFLHKHLDQYGDPIPDIQKSIEYAMSDQLGKGGFVLTSYYDDQMVGAVVMNKTGMSGYIPDYILVYIAVDSKYRGKGIGAELIQKALKLADGDVKLHVEYDNPAKQLYEKIGFKNKYAEMRFIK